MNQATLTELELRLGRLYARQRLGIERDHEARIFGQGINFFHIENWYSVHSIIRAALKLTGLHWRGVQNAQRIQVKHNEIRFKTLPSQFDGFTVLHISDLHVEMNQGAMQRLIELLPGKHYDVCVLTGDYRATTFGSFDAALEGLARVRACINGTVYGVLGNYDTIQMVPGLEGMGIRMLLNECEAISRDDQCIYLAGIDDAHYYQVDNIEKAASEIPHDGFSILLFTHTGNLSAGSSRWLQFASERPHPRGANMSAWVYPDHPGFCPAEAHGLGPVEVSRDDRLYVRRCRIIHCSCSDQLSAGNYPPPPSMRLRAPLPATWPLIRRSGRLSTGFNSLAQPPKGRGDGVLGVILPYP